MNKRILTGLAAAGVSLALLTAGGGCSSNTPGSSSADTIKIGINYELSGAVATYGTGALNGVKMAADEINAKGGINGKKIELIQYDNKSDAAESMTLATKLMTQDKVITVIGMATSGDIKATIPVANANKVPVISGSATADDVTVDASGKVQPYAFRTCFNDSFQGTAGANYALQKFNAKTAVIYKDSSSDYAKGLADNFRKTFEAAGGKVVDEQAYVAGDTDFNSVLTKIKGEQFDVIYLPGYYQEAGLIIKAARGMGITAPILGGDGYDSPTLLELAGASALNNVYFTNHYSSLNTSPKVQTFIASFKAKYNTDPDGFAAGGYDTMNLVADAISRATALTGEAVATALASTKNFVAVTGTLTIGPDHNPIKSAVVIGLKDGVQSTADVINP